MKSTPERIAGLVSPNPDDGSARSGGDRQRPAGRHREIAPARIELIGNLQGEGRRGIGAGQAQGQRPGRLGGIVHEQDGVHSGARFRSGGKAGHRLEPRRRRLRDRIAVLVRQHHLVRFSDLREQEPSLVLPLADMHGWPLGLPPLGPHQEPAQELRRAGFATVTSIPWPSGPRRSAAGRPATRPGAPGREEPRCSR